MTSFRFSLQKVLEWRQAQLAMEEAKLKRQLGAMAELDRARAELDARGIQTEVQVRSWSPLEGRDLAALGAFRTHVRMQEREIAARRAECSRLLETQEAAMLEARRRCRLLERLKDRRLAAWRKACDREVEELAAESYLAGWGRREG